MSRESFPIPAEFYFRVRDRALTFAKSHDANVTLTVLKVSPASCDEITKFGTAGSALYAQVVVRTQPSAAAVEAAVEEALLSQSAEDVAELRRFLESPLDLRIVCSVANVIHHQFLNCDICCGGDEIFELPGHAPLVPTAEDSPFCKRAIALALSHVKYCQADILQVGPAAAAVIEKYGTISSTRYRNVVLRVHYSSTFQAQLLEFEATQRYSNLDSVRGYLARPHGLQVTCSATDIIHHQWLSLQNPSLS